MDAVFAQMRNVIDARLADIAKEDDIKILLAVESGSRAWGFHSPDSDYDVRFIYARPVDWHLGLATKRDVVERPIDDELDLSGWDIGKALTLALGSNAVIAEWLQSPIVYCAEDGFVEDLTSFCAQVLDRKSVSWHYLSLYARQEKRARLDDGQIQLKRYFYMIRPILALRWMRVNGKSMPPMDMGNLCAGSDLSAVEAEAIRELTERKKTISERGQVGASVPILDQMTSTEEAETRNWLLSAKPNKAREADWAAASDLNRKYVRIAGP
jgi:predicted nucleotidyltransferase